MGPTEREDMESRDVYQRGVEFFDKLFDGPVPGQYHHQPLIRKFCPFLPGSDFVTRVTSDLISKQKKHTNNHWGCTMFKKVCLN